ncbi:MAG: WecB/TagA/CpsF family glycosyltransferase [Patescibacteria group bacterium]
MFKKGRQIKQILGISVDSTSISSVLSICEEFLISRGKFYVVTPNPEMMVLAQNDLEFKKALNNADLAIPDGWGLRWGNPEIGQRVSGREVMLGLIDKTRSKDIKTLLVGGKPGIAQAAAFKLGVLGITDPDIELINKIQPQLLFVALGHGKQEKWIAKNLPKLKVKIAMGVGGALDQVAKPWLIAPKWMQTFGLEWLWRLILQPWRIKRQFSLVKYVYLVLKEKMVKYRYAVK